MPVSVDYSGLLFRMTILDAYFRCLFQMTFPDDCRMPPNDCFRLLFQMNISDACFKWLFRMTVGNSTTDSYFSGQSVFPRSIPISTYHSTDWSHGKFVFEGRLSTGELWPRSPLILIMAFRCDIYGRVFSRPCIKYFKWQRLHCF